LAAAVAYAELTLPTSIPGSERSKQRVEQLESTLLKYYRKNPNATTSAAAQTIEKQTSSAWKNYIANSRPYTVDDCLLEARSRIEKAAEKAFPLASDAELEAMAEKKYPLYKVGERVKVLYRTNPQYPSKIEGVFKGERNGYLRIGQSSIRREDMASVAGNEEEILKFDQAATEKVRKTFIRNQRFAAADGRKEFIEKNENEIMQSTLKDFTAINEERGFTYLDGAWLNPTELLEQLAKNAKAIFSQEQEQERLAEGRIHSEIAHAQSNTIQLSNSAYPPPLHLNPTEVLKKQEEARQKRLAEEAKKKEEEELRKQKAEEAERQRKEREAAKNARKQKPVIDEETPEPIIGMGAIIGIIAGVIVLAAGCVAYIIIKRKKDEKKFTSFFEGKGAVQKAFWDKANADPENFKYVTYMFPNEEEARNALLQLSYISALPNGALKCSKNIDYGTYPHNGKEIAFIGGTDLHYAPWREATAVMPELPNAQYFKVSTEPSVQLEMPNMAEQNIDIKDLGREEIRTEDGSIMLCYKYSCLSKEDAMYFLENLTLNEEGVTIQVETPEGYLGKDMEGIFEMETPLATGGNA
ncbi:MAG: hypothetical protein IKS20_13890, partial [Victivallales bacterium]|nr:hypothetical protein [Victivallales bacterium]